MNNEALRPLKNRAGFLRMIFDLQVCSTYRGLNRILALEGHKDGRNVLDVGCGDSPYRYTLLKDYVYKGIDYYGAKNDFDYHVPEVEYYNGIDFPLTNDEFDWVFHTEVAEQ